MRHFERHEQEGPVILRVEFQSLLRANPAAEPLNCRYNSDSPRCSSGKQSRGPSTFLLAEEFNGRPSQAVEVTFVGQIVLPAGPQIYDTSALNKFARLSISAALASPITK